jgi:hypothetical protein
MNWWLNFKVRLELWLAFQEFKRAARKVQELPQYEAARVLTKWRWDASHVTDPDMRDKLSMLVATVEKTIKLKHGLD